MTKIPFRMNGLILLAAAALLITPAGLSAAEASPLDRALANKAGGPENSPSRRLQRSRHPQPESESPKKEAEKSGESRTALANKAGGVENSMSRRLQRSRQAQPESEPAEKAAESLTADCTALANKAGGAENSMSRRLLRSRGAGSRRV